MKRRTAAKELKRIALAIGSAFPGFADDMNDLAEQIVKPRRARPVAPLLTCPRCRTTFGVYCHTCGYDFKND